MGSYVRRRSASGSCAGSLRRWDRNLGNHGCSLRPRPRGTARLEHSPRCSIVPFFQHNLIMTINKFMLLHFAVLPTPTTLTVMLVTCCVTPCPVCTVLSVTVLYCTVLYSTLLYTNVLHCTVQYSTVQYTTRYCTVQHCL